MGAIRAFNRRRIKVTEKIRGIKEKVKVQEQNSTERGGEVKPTGRERKCSSP